MAPIGWRISAGVERLLPAPLVGPDQGRVLKLKFRGDFSRVREREKMATPIRQSLARYPLARLARSAAAAAGWPLSFPPLLS